MNPEYYLTVGGTTCPQQYYQSQLTPYQSQLNAYGSYILPTTSAGMLPQHLLKKEPEAVKEPSEFMWLRARVEELLWKKEAA